MRTILTLCAAIACLVARPPSTTPGVRFGHSLVYDSADEQILLVDGYSWVNAVSPVTPPEQTELWAWKGDRWTALAERGPSSRTMARAVFDSHRKALISFGGRVGRAESPSAETWERRNSHWRPLADASSGPSVHVELAYDEARATTVRFGGALRPGSGGLIWPTTTWAWSGDVWRELTSEGPPGRAATAMVYDSGRQEIVLFGGQGAAPADDQPQVLYGDTWVWNGRTWRAASAAGPGPRSFHAMSFDRRHGLVLLHGGERRGVLLDDLWAWNGAGWRELPQPGTAPGRRRLHAMAYDARRDKTVLYGGVGRDADGVTRAYDDTWEWDGARWVRAQ
jgi:hypothetical protein